MTKTIRAVLAAMLIVLVSSAAFAEKTEVVFDETFDVDSGWELQLDVDDMDVEIQSGESDRARVKVTIMGNLDKARERYEKSEFDAYLDGKKLVVGTDERHRWSFFSFGNYRVGIQVTVTIPKKFDVFVKTSDGDVVAGDIEGEIELKTSDGDVDVEELRGPSIFLKTSDGDVTVGALIGGDVEIRTSDGDLNAKLIRGDEVTMSTSDGDVTADMIEAKLISVRSSDGDLDIEVSGDELRGRTSDGDIDVRIDGKIAVELVTSDGNVTIRAPSDIGADLDLKGEHVKLGGKMELDGEVSKRRIVGKLGGGGPVVRARTSDGSVVIRFF